MLLWIKDLHGLKQLFVPFSGKHKTMIYDRFLTYDVIFSWIKSNKGKKLLDIGCGYSIFPSFLALNGFDVTVCDIDDNAIKWQKSISEKHHLNMKTVTFLGKKLPFDKENFSIVTSISALEHTPHDKEIFKEMYRVLKTDGVAIIEIPFSPYYIETIDLADEKSREGTAFANTKPTFEGEVFRYYTSKDIDVIIQLSNLKLAEVYLFPYYFGGVLHMYLTDHLNGLPILMSYVITKIGKKMDELVFQEDHIPYSDFKTRFRIPPHVILKFEK